jgi:thioesterase domain-containing protein
MTMKNKRTTDTRGKLSKIWRRVLKREHIGGTDNFFELGGNPRLAVELFRDIERAFGRALPPVVIYQAPTIASLKVLVDAPACPPFAKYVAKYVELRSGSLWPPVFITHGLGGNVMELFGFVNHLQCAHPIYGLQERGMDGLEEPCSSVEEMAQRHVETMRTLQPVGPYILIGYSFGGLVAHEMARHLAETGGSIALLVMIDAYPCREYVLQYASTMQKVGAHYIKVRNYALRKLRSDSRIQSFGMDLTPAMQRVLEKATRALHSYQPRYYDGCIRFVKAKTNLFYPNQEQLWANFAEHFVVERVNGNHLSLMRTYHENLATVISRYLGELSVGKLVGSSH